MIRVCKNIEHVCDETMAAKLTLKHRDGAKSERANMLHTVRLHGDKVPLIVTDMWPVRRSRSSARFRVPEPDLKTSVLSGYQSVKYQQPVNGMNQAQLHRHKPAS